MSITPDPVTAAVPEANPQQAANNVVAEADSHTPSTDHVAPQANSTADTTNGDTGLAELREVVSKLAETVNTLVGMATNKVDPEQTPEKLPLLLRGKHVPND